MSEPRPHTSSILFGRLPNRGELAESQEGRRGERSAHFVRLTRGRA